MISDSITFAVQQFYAHLENQKPEKYGSVEEYVAKWVTDGAAWKLCLGDSQFFFIVVAHIIALWHDDRTSCPDESEWSGPIPWSVTRVFKNHEDTATEIFDPYFFRFWAPEFMV